MQKRIYPSVNKALPNSVSFLNNTRKIKHVLNRMGHMGKSCITRGKVIPLFLNSRITQNGITQEVLNYWESLRHGRLVPKRSEIDPRALQRSLDYTFILEASAPDNIRFRLAGSKLSDCMGMEIRGMPAYAMMQMDVRNRYNQMLQTALARPEILDLQLSPTARMVLLPMAGEDNNVSRFLGCVNVDANRPDFPTRFNVCSVTKTRIIAAKSIEPKLMGLAQNHKQFT